MKKILPLLLVVALLSMAPPEYPKEIPLWPKGAPGSEGKTGAEKVKVSSSGEISVSGVNNPSITPFLPSAAQATGAAIIIAPGGGHTNMAITHEGYNPAQWMQAHGVAAFVLKYRLAKEAGSTYTVDGDAVPDMQRAIRLVRSRAKEWGIDTARIGVMGFSAGGELAALTAMRFANPVTKPADAVDRESAMPNFQALIYPGNSARYDVNKGMPPVFIACGYKDRQDIAEGMAQLYLKYKQAGIPAELHIYANIGHGFGIRPTTKGEVAKWPEQFYDWLNDTGFLKKK